jgi:hypothetical protein
MENIIININNSNYDQMSHLKTTSIKMSTFEKLMNSKEFVKEIQLGIKKRGNANYLIALVNKTKSLTKYMIETTDYIKENFLNSNLFYKLTQNLESPIEIIEDKQSLKSESTKENYLNIYPNLLKEYVKEGILNIPVIVLNKFIKLGCIFVADLAKDHIIIFKHKAESNYLIFNFYKILNSFFNPTSSIISQPQIKESTNSVKLTVFFYNYVLKSKNKKKSSINFIERNKNRLQYLCEILSPFFKKPLNILLIRLYNLTSESMMLTRTIGKSINKIKFRVVKSKTLRKFYIVNTNKVLDKKQYIYNSLFDSKTINPAQLAGLSIRVAGRVLSERVVPRKTVRSLQIGSLARDKASIVNTQRFTTKNKRGTYSITVKTGHLVT